MGQELLFSEEILRAGDVSLEEVRKRAMVCQRCPLCKTRNNVVFGEGCPDRPPIAFVGEAPGANEDAQGRPFIGRAGQLLDKMIGAMDLSREQVYICNAINCRPPENRKPERAEIEACKMLLVCQLRIVQPSIIVTLGASATHALTTRKKGIGALRGRWMEWKDKGKGALTGAPIPLRATYHPAYLLRTPKAKKAVWEDLQIVMKWLNRTTDKEK